MTHVIRTKCTTTDTTTFHFRHRRTFRTYYLTYFRLQDMPGINLHSAFGMADPANMGVAVEIAFLSSVEAEF